MARQDFGNSIAEVMQRQSVAGASLGIAPGSQALRPSAFETGEPPRTLLFQKIIVPAGATIPAVIRGNYVYVESVVYDTYATYNIGYASTAPTIKPDTGQATVQLLEPRREIQFPVAFNNLQIANPNPNFAVVVSLWIGFGQIRRDTSRRMKDYGVGVILSNHAYAANRVIGSNPLVFQEVTSSSNQRARIKKASCVIDMAGAGVVTAGADISLWLHNRAMPAAVDDSVFQLSQNFTGGVAYTHPTQIRFPSFVTGGAGSDAAICDIADIDIEIASAYKESYGIEYFFSMFGLVVNNTAYTPGASGAVRFYLTFEQG
jgi:hypothetical protein